MKALCIAILSFVVIAAAGCGGSGGSTGGPTPTPTPTPTPAPNPTPTPVTTGEYLFEGTGVSSLNLATINSTTGALSSPMNLTSQADDNVIYPGVAVAPSKKFLYSLFSSFTVVTAFQLSGPGLQITELANAPFFLPASAGPMNSLVQHPSGDFLYVIESGSTIQAFSANATTGNLTTGPALTVGTGDFRVAAIEPTGKFLYVTDLTGGRIFGFQINTTDGSLTAIAGSPFTAVSATSEPSIPVIDRTGHFLYVSLLSGIAAFAIDGSTGALTAISGSPFATSSEAVFLAADPQANFLYGVTVTNGLVDGFAIDPTTGILTSVPGSPFATAQPPSNIIVDPSGKFVYVSIESGSSIFGFSLDPSTGALTPLAGSPFASVANATNLFIASF